MGFLGWGGFAYMVIKCLNIETSNIKTVWGPDRCENEPRSEVKFPYNVFCMSPSVRAVCVTSVVAILFA